MNEDFKVRQQYIRANNELSKGPNVDAFRQGNINKVELDRKLEELSINSGQSFSGNLVRQNILNSSASCATTLNNSIDYDENYKEDENTKAERILKNGINRGRENMNNMGMSNQNSATTSFNFNRFNRNI